MEKQLLVPGDPTLIENIVSYLKAKGIFDEFRHECLADVDTKSSCQNLSQRVDGYTTKFLSTETWNPDLNKNELRNKLRRHIDESGMLAVGADHVVEQVINPKIHQLFLPRIIEVVHQYLNQENEKLNKKQEAIDNLAKSEKAAAENSDKPKPVLDPIADILSFTYSKPKQAVQTPTSSALNKFAEPLKTEKKKEESIPQTKLPEGLVKIEKKKEDVIIGKVQDITQKVKKEEILLPPKAQSGVTNIEKKEEETSDPSAKIQLSDSNEDSSQPVALQPKPVEIKVKKEVKEESEGTHEGQKKLQKEEPKVDKKKIEDSKLPKSEATAQSDETVPHKAFQTPTKSNSGLSKSKLDSEKKKIKSHSQHKTSSLSESHKVKTKDSSGNASSKSSDKHAKSSLVKHSKTSSSKDSSPSKITSSKSLKSEREDSGNKGKSVEAHMKSPESSVKKNVPSKSSSSKKEVLPIKVKHSSDKHDKQKMVKTLVQSPCESSAERTKKSSVQYSSSYESSQGSDQDRSSASSISSKEKQKHFSKHQKKEIGDRLTDRHAKGSVDKKRPRTDSDSGLDKKHKNEKHSSKHLVDKQRKSSVAQESAKIDSRSNSLGSSSSTSDSQLLSSKDNPSSTSEDTSDNASKQLEKKRRQMNKDQDRCRDFKNLPPPPPPPPSSSLGAGTSSSAEVSSMDETQSSQESDFEDDSSEEESSYDSELEQDVLNLKIPDNNNIYDIFLYSSSSEFDGFTSEEINRNASNCAASDFSVSSVHTSDLSSFEGEISCVEHSDSETGSKKVKRKLTLKEAEDLLRAKAEKRRSILKNTSPDVRLSERKSSNSSLQRTLAMLSEEEVSTRPEPKRESRRERKLNPKYASSEYASIFNSKKTSFITKQANQMEVASPAPSPEMNSDKRTDSDSKKTKDKQLSIRRNLFPSSDADQCPKAASKLPRNEFFEPPSSPECSFVIADSSSVGLPTVSVHSSLPDKNHNTVGEGDSHSRIALKIKMSAIKSDNQTNTDKNTHGLKRKFDGESPAAKKVCHNNSISAEGVANENEPFNNKTNSSSLVLSVEQKEFFQKQKGNNNGDVLNKIERKSSYSKPNHVAENNTSD